MVGEKDGASAAGVSTRRPYWRSQSWSASRSTGAVDGDGLVDSAEKDLPQNRRLPVLLTPRSQQNCKARSCLPPLQPLAIARRSVDEWPKASSDDVGEWALPLTPGGRKPGEELKVDLSLLRSEGRRSQMAFFDKECSKVAEHIYLGGDAVAKDREILRKHGITHVLNCVGFVCPEYFKSDLVYRTLWLQDNPSEDITSILYDVFDYFEDVREQRGKVLVHCCQGVSRSTSLVIAYLMWREGQSFEDAFDLVKSARGIANPNMGFACQLLQCQKRVHAIPLSPNSLLRMYRMAPHSPYDALHLVPKMLNEPSSSALDSRGAFIVQVPSSIYVWIGKRCEKVMEKDAKAATYQLLRYEKVSGPIVIVEEGEEPLDFWEAFSKVTFTPDLTLKIKKEQIVSVPEAVAGKRKVEAYDTDFELFYKGLYGGVLPPFSSAGTGHETHIPARESSWSVLRWKFVSSGSILASKAAMNRVYSDSMFVRESDISLNKGHLSTTDSLSPLNPSPSPLSSDLSNSSNCSLDIPIISPSIDHQHSSCNITDAVSSSQILHKLPTCSEPGKFSLRAMLSPSKRFARSIAERRGGFSPSLKLSAMANESSQACQHSSNASSDSHVSLKEAMLTDSNTDSSNQSKKPERSTANTTSNISDHCGTTLSTSQRFTHTLADRRGNFSPSLRLSTFVNESSRSSQEDLKAPAISQDALQDSCSTSVDVLDKLNNFKQRSGANSNCNNYQQCAYPSRGIFSQENWFSFANGLAMSSEQLQNSSFPLAYRWPDFKKIEPIHLDDFDSQAVFLILVHDAYCGSTANLKFYLWIGSSYMHAPGQPKVIGNKARDCKQFDWNQVGSDILKSMNLPTDIPIKVVREEDSKEFLGSIFTMC